MRDFLNNNEKSVLHTKKLQYPKSNVKTLDIVE